MSVTLAFELLEQIAGCRPADCCGLGVVFYHHLEALPRLGLGDQDHQPVLPVSGLVAIASTLASISSASSLWHDGFHLVNNLGGPELTHVSQYLSPPIALRCAADIGCSRPTGARHMTALLVSQLEGIACVGLLTNQGEATIFERGVLVPRRQRI